MGKLITISRLYDSKEKILRNSPLKRCRMGIDPMVLRPLTRKQIKKKLICTSAMMIYMTVLLLRNRSLLIR